MSVGLRDRKKAQTRERIVEAAARLFAEHGYERVAVIEVARAADVAEKTVYNYFPTKEQLVLDRDDEERERVVELLLRRAPGTSPAAAIRDDALAIVEQFRGIPDAELRGHIGYLATISPTIHRRCLEMADRHATAFAQALVAGAEAGPTDLCRAKVVGIALAWIYQTIIDEMGRMTADGFSSGQIADGLAPVVAAVLDDIDHLPVPVGQGRR